MLSQIFTSTLQIITAFYLTIVLLRFLLQLARADFYNPICQFTVKATTPVLRPLRRIIPAWGSIDGASLVLAIGIQALEYTLILLAQSYSLNILILLAWSIITVLALILKIYTWSLIAVILLSWIAPATRHPAAALLFQLTEPIMRPFRRLLPPMGGLDLSPILVFLVLNFLTIAVNHLAASVGLSAVGIAF